MMHAVLANPRRILLLDVWMNLYATGFLTSANLYASPQPSLYASGYAPSDLLVNHVLMSSTQICY